MSAHRGGAAGVPTAENTIAAFEAAIAMGCDYVEFDVRVTADGQPVIFHDDEIGGDDGQLSIARLRSEEIAGAGIIELDTVLALIRGRVKAHVDLKVPGDEIALVAHIVDALGTDDVIITTAEDASVRRIVAWSRTHAPDLLVGLSSGRRLWQGGRWTRYRVTVEAMFPRTRVRRSRANLVVAHKLVARLSLRSYARRHGLPLLVWTVDRPGELDRWMNDPAVWMVTTNHPERAFAARR